MQKPELIAALYDLGVLQFGQFTLKSGLASPFYLDFRRIVGRPQVLRSISEALWSLIEQEDFEHLCGVPYAALSLGATMSVLNNRSMLVKRKEAKKHGTKKLVEGIFQAGQRCVVIDDVISSGISMIETIEALEDEGLLIEHVVSIVDREQGGVQALEAKGYKVHALFRLPELMQELLALGKISRETAEMTLQFIQGNSISFEELRRKKAQLPSYSELRKEAKHPAALRLLECIERKSSNLCFSADVDSAQELLKLADLVGPDICLLKTHIDSLDDYSPELTSQLKELAQKHNFLLFEDRKLADIGHIVQKQLTAAPFSIGSWADFVTVHPVAGSLGLEALRQSKALQNTGLILVAEMSTLDSLTKGPYITKAIDMAAEYADVVVGIVAQNHRPKAPGQLLFTPGIHLGQSSDGLGQKYRSPSQALGFDVAIVGRGIYQSEKPQELAQAYRQTAWQVRKVGAF